MPRLGTWIIALAAITSTLAANSISAKEPHLCSQIAHTIRRACSNEVTDEQWIQTARCLNLADAAARTACKKETRTARGEATAECRDQEAARVDLCDQLGPGAYDPPIAPSRFLSAAAIAANPNPFLPLKPGAVWTYENGDEQITVTVTDTTRTILGVECVVVHDFSKVNGVLNEDTDDYFAQDVDGNVWYFGELSQSFENGLLSSLDGSWTAGVDGARPGIAMPAAPVVGAVYRQEFAIGDAEDAGEVLSITGTESAPGGSCTGTCVVTHDFSPIEPDANEQKFYAPGIGLILTIDKETGDREELLSVVMP